MTEQTEIAALNACIDALEKQVEIIGAMPDLATKSDGWRLWVACRYHLAQLREAFPKEKAPPS
jgi:hypothetical protein